MNDLSLYGQYDTSDSYNPNDAYVSSGSYAPSNPNVPKEHSKTSTGTILMWVAIALLFVLVIVALTLSVISHTSGGLTDSEKAVLLAVSTKVGFDGNILIAEGFSDNASALQNAATAPFLATGGVVTCETISAAGVATAASLTTTGNISTPLGTVISEAVRSNSLALAPTALQNVAFTPALLNMQDTTAVATTSLRAGSLTFTGPGGTQSVLSSTGLLLDDRVLNATRYLCSGMSTAVSTNGGKMAPLTGAHTYGTMSIPAADLAAGSTFRISGQGLYASTGVAAIQLVLVNGTSYTPQTQVFIGDAISTVSQPVPANPVTLTPTFLFDYLVTLDSFLTDGTARTFTAGSVTFSEDQGFSSSEITISAIYPLPPATTGGIIVTSGFNFSLWLVLTGTPILTLKRISVVQIA